MSIESVRVILNSLQGGGVRHVQIGLTDHLGIEHRIFRIIPAGIDIRTLIPAWKVTVLENLENAEIHKILNNVESGKSVPEFKYVTATQVRAEYARRKAELDDIVSDASIRKARIEAGEA